MPDDDFDARFARQLQDYAQGGVRRIDRHAVAEDAIRAGDARSQGWWAAIAGRRGLTPVVAALLAVGLAAGTMAAGAWLLTQRPTPTPDRPTVIVDAPASVTPCPSMLQLLSAWELPDPSAGLPADGDPSERPDALLFTGLATDGSVLVDAIDLGARPPQPFAADASGRPFPSVPGFPLSSQGRIVASPDGRAVALEEGDPGQAGCGDPLVLTTAGIRRPFPVGAFERVSDLAWAPDTSALYAVRRPTLDEAGRPYVTPQSGEVMAGPGTVLRWDAATGDVTVLGPGCGACGPLFVSPDGTRLATTDGDSIVVREPDGTWVIVTTVDGPLGWNGLGLLGWVDDASVVWSDSTQATRVALDRTVHASWRRPPAHSWTVGPLSPDGSTIAGMTLSDDMLSWQVVLLDMLDGSSQVLWSAPDPRGCTAFTAGSTGRADCEAASSISPGATPDPATAISGHSRVVAWAPDGSAVVLLDQVPDAPAAIIRIVATDGSGASGPVAVTVPDLTGVLGLPNIGPAVAWLPTTAP